jgi:hypothetical protein
LLAIVSCCWCSASLHGPGVLEVSFLGLIDARNLMPMFVCRSVSKLLCYFDVCVF